MTESTASDPATRDTLRRRWRDGLAEWRIPPAILAGATASPWTAPPALFAARARLQIGSPSGISAGVAAQALPLDGGGSVLDVGAGTGAASFALRGHATHLTAVDEDAGMLTELAALADDAGVAVTTVHGTWPEVGPTVPPVDVVVCHHVLYNVAELEPFVAQLTAHSRSRVVVEITPAHPAALLNPLWKTIHGIDRPDRPTAADAIALITGLGLDPKWHAWQRPITAEGTSYPELVASTCRRLCLGEDRAPDVDAALRDLGAGPDKPYVGPSMRDLVTIWWPGFAH